MAARQVLAFEGADSGAAYPGGLGELPLRQARPPARPAQPTSVQDHDPPPPIRAARLRQRDARDARRDEGRSEIVPGMDIAADFAVPQADQRGIRCSAADEPVVISRRIRDTGLEAPLAVGESWRVRLGRAGKIDSGAGWHEGFSDLVYGRLP
jgi:hypothetical protein